MDGKGFFEDSVTFSGHAGYILTLVEEKYFVKVVCKFYFYTLMFKKGSLSHSPEYKFYHTANVLRIYFNDLQ